MRPFGVGQIRPIRMSWQREIQAIPNWGKNMYKYVISAVFVMEVDTIKGTLLVHTVS